VRHEVPLGEASASVGRSVAGVWPDALPLLAYSQTCGVVPGLAEWGHLQPPQYRSDTRRGPGRMTRTWTAL